MPANLENSAVTTTGKGLFSAQSQSKAMPKNAQALPVHRGKVVHSPSTPWISWEPFIRNLGMQAYFTTSLCPYSFLCISFPFLVRSLGGVAHDFTFPTVEILCK